MFQIPPVFSTVESTEYPLLSFVFCLSSINSSVPTNAKTHFVEPVKLFVKVISVIFKLRLPAFQLGEHAGPRGPVC